jgi:hypothetical protein
MSDYDYYVLGLGNEDHPANRVEIEQEVFESENLQECMNYAKDYCDFEPLESAIYNVEKIKIKAVENIDFCLNFDTENILIREKLLEIRRMLLNNSIY